MHSKVEYIVAHGISTTIEEQKAVIGSYHFVFEDEKCVIPEDGQEKFDSIPEEYSHLYLAIDGRLAAVICIEDPLREEAKASVEALRAARNLQDRYDDRRQRAYSSSYCQTCRCG